VTTEGNAAQLLAAFATSALATVRELCAEDVTVYGTDQGERWDNLEALCAALDAMRALGLSARWETAPVDHGGWIAGVAMYSIPGQGVVPVRVTLVFEKRKLVHGHFSLEQRTDPASAPAPPTAPGV
jgi:hypothetical protein